MAISWDPNTDLERISFFTAPTEPFMIRRIHLPILFLMVRSVNGQEVPTGPKVRNDEVGVDVTYFIRQFTNFNNGGGGGAFIVDPYLVTYRHYFTSFNLRSGIGLSRTVRDGNAYYQPYGLRTEQTMVDGRLGVEWREELTRKWQVFYGGDVRYGLYKRSEDPAYFNGGYAHSQWTTTERIGLAALIGARFRIGERMSLTTESAISYMIANTETLIRETPIVDGVDPIDDRRTSERTEALEISVPVSVVFTVTL